MNQGSQRSQESVEQAHVAAEALHAINQSVSTITDMNNKIADATERQSAGGLPIPQRASPLKPSISHETNRTFIGSIDFTVPTLDERGGSSGDGR